LERGLSVVVLERAELGAGETGKTTAHLTAVLDDRYYDLQRMHGDASARLVARSHEQAIAHLERLANVRRIACDFERVDAFLFATREEHRAMLEKEQRAASEVGLSCRLLRKAPLPFEAGPALQVERQAKFNPGKFMLGIARAVRELGGLIAAPAHVQEIGGDDGVRKVVTTRGETVQARHLVIATDTPVNDTVAMHTKQAPYRSYALALELVGELPAGLFWDMEDPYHYVRTSPTTRSGSSEGSVLIVGGEDHKVGQEAEPERCWQRLEAWTRERFPMAGAIVNQWSGQILEPSDGLAYIGRNPGQKNVYIATGFSGNGMTYGAISALLLADVITGVDNPWRELYDPTRKPSSIPAVSTYVSENANVAVQYLDWVRPGDVGDTDAIQAGEGAVIRRGFGKLAVYRDPSGYLHEFSATCPHLGGVVAWNRAEKTWDCPCHGSRFDCYGKVLNGPAISGLRPAEDKDQGEEGELAGVALP
jgi:glycine/D-amino acid oxidase-like deaminating enzyme/nitrite reductase/ring-hydroxylating ferredoxin subunit